MKADPAQLIRYGGRHRAILFAALVLIGGLAAAAILLRGHFTNDVSRLFPDTRETRATFGILHKSHLSDTVQLEFVCDGDVTKHEKYLDRTAERLAGSPTVKKVTFRYRPADAVRMTVGFSTLAPRFFPPEILDRCDPDAAAKGALKQLVLHLPTERAQNDPFGWDMKFLGELEKLDKALGMRFDRSFPYFVNADHTRALIFVETDVRLGDADAVRRLFSELRRCAAPLPAGVGMRIISGCTHTLGNEEVLKRDAMIAGAVSFVLFLLLFVWFYRGDRRALWIPVLPLYASFVSLAVMTFFFREICLYVIGLGGCITGLAVDQGIHVYAAFRGDEAEKRTAALAEPMLLSAATSVAVFVFLAFTGIAAYVQLAVFAGLSLVLSALLALLVLPHLLNRNHRLRRVFSTPPVGGRRKWAPVAVAVAVAAALAALPQVIGRADFALESLDGTPEKTLREEREFSAAWHDPKGDTAALAAAGDNSEAALERLLDIAAALRKRGVTVAVPPRPTLAAQRATRTKWRTPEVAARIDALEAGCRTACLRVFKGRNPDFFAPFFQRLRAEISGDSFRLPAILEYIDGRMIKSHGESAAAVALLPDSPENAAIVREVLRERNEERAALLSKAGFKLLIREELGGRFKWLLPLSVLAALAMLFAVFRKVGDVILAMVPVAVAFSGVALVMYLTRFRATPAAAFALVLLTGLSVDYGIYAVSQLRRPGELDTADPILLSAATTVAGAGALLVSRHPALFGTGVVLAPGIALACLSGIYIVPMLKNAKLPKKTLTVLVAAVSALSVSGCATATPWAEYPGKDAALRQMRPYPEGSFKMQALVTVEVSLKRTFRFVLAAELDEKNGIVKFAGVDPGSSALLFKYSGKPTEKPLLGEMLLQSVSGGPAGLEGFLWSFSRDLRRIFLLKDDLPLAATEKAEYIAVDSANNVSWELRRDGPAMRKCGTFPFRRWRTVYLDGGRRMIYDRYDGGMGYTLKIRINNLHQVKK